VYILRLKDTQRRIIKPSILMIHPVLIALKNDLQKVGNAEFNFEEKGKMNSTLAQFPKCKQSESDRIWNRREL